MSARALVLALVVLIGCAKPQPSGRASAAGDTTSGTQGLPVMQQRLLEAANILLPPGVAPESLPEPASQGAKILGGDLQPRSLPCQLGSDRYRPRRPGLRGLGHLYPLQ